jgi:hypothetical protein
VIHGATTNSYPSQPRHPSPAGWCRWENTVAAYSQRIGRHTKEEFECAEYIQDMRLAAVSAAPYDGVRIITQLIITVTILVETSRWRRLVRQSTCWGLIPRPESWWWRHQLEGAVFILSCIIFHPTIPDGSTGRSYRNTKCPLITRCNETELIVRETCSSVSRRAFHRILSLAEIQSRLTRAFQVFVHS